MPPNTLEIFIQNAKIRLQDANRHLEQANANSGDRHLVHLMTAADLTYGAVINLLNAVASVNGAVIDGRASTALRYSRTHLSEESQQNIRYIFALHNFEQNSEFSETQFREALSFVMEIIQDAQSLLNRTPGASGAAR